MFTKTSLVDPNDYSLNKAFAHFFSGLAVGLSGLASGYCMGVIGDHGMSAVSRNPKLYIGMLLILIFAEAIGLYGLIVALILISAQGPSCHPH
jgi:V-type H+-transporting ATPase proteolipid subunit